MSSKSKGNAAELEVVKLVQAAGWPNAHRNFASGGQGGSDIAAGPGGVTIEVKHQEQFKLKTWWKQASADAEKTQSMPVLAVRWNRGPWLAVLDLDELLALIAARELT